MNLLQAFLAYVPYLLSANTLHSVQRMTGGKMSLMLPSRADLYHAVSYEQRLKQDSVKIAYSPMGAGSRIVQKAETCRDIVKRTGTGQKYGRLLAALVQMCEAKNVLELGTCLGTGAMYLAAGSPKTHVDTVEGSTGLFTFSSKQLKLYGGNRISTYNMCFEEFLEHTDKTYDMIYLDGDHRADAVFALKPLLDARLKNGGLLVFDDIHWSKDMQFAWQQLASGSCLAFSSFRMGVLLPEENGGHYPLRY